MIIILCIMYLGQIEFAEMLIQRGANVNIADENHNTAQHLAVGEGDVEFFFLFCFSPPRKVSLIKSILLQLALGHVKILELLIKGDNINDFNKDGKSLLHLSIEKGTYIFWSV